MVQFKSKSLFDIYKVEKLAQLRPILYKICVDKLKGECDQISDEVVEFERKLQRSKVISLNKNTENIFKYDVFAGQFINKSLVI